MKARPDRLPDWHSRLGAFVAANRDRRMDYRRWDCVRLALGGVLAVTGRDLSPDWTWSSRSEGLGRLRAMGLADHFAAARALLPAVSPAEALPGDLALLPGAALGIVQGRHLYVVTRAGIGLAPRTAMIGALAV